MPDLLFIFGAKYLIFASILLTGYYLFVSPIETRKKLMIFLLISLPFAYIVGIGAREMYVNPRPFAVENFEPLVAHAADNGFPSDHVLLAASLAAILFFFNRRYAAWLGGFAIFIAVSRVYVGVHHSLDVLASIGIAMLCAIIISKLYARK